MNLINYIIQIIIPIIMILIGIYYKIIPLEDQYYNSENKIKNQIMNKETYYYSIKLKSRMLIIFGLILIILLFIENFIFNILFNFSKLFIYSAFIISFLGSKLYFNFKVKRKLILFERMYSNN